MVRNEFVTTIALHDDDETSEGHRPVHVQRNIHGLVRYDYTTTAEARTGHGDDDRAAAIVAIT